MGRKHKITDEQLQKELENGSTYKEICYEYGYGYPSRQLRKRIRELGWNKRPKLSVNDFGSANISLEAKHVDEMMEKSDLDDKEKIFIHREVTDSGEIVLKPSNREFFRSGSDG